MNSEPPYPGYRLIQLIQRNPPPEILRHAEMIPGKTGLYGKVVCFKHERTKTVYQVLHFKAGRPPTREEVLAGLRADLAALDSRSAASQQSGKLSGWIDRTFFTGESLNELKRKRRDIEETIAAVEETYKPGEAVPVP